MNRFLLAIIALGLWANAVTTIIKPAHAELDSADLRSIEKTLDTIHDDTSGIRRDLSGPLIVRCENCSQ